MRTLFDNEIRVHYGQIYVVSTPEYPNRPQCFGGQKNGICGGAVAGCLFLCTGLHTGRVGCTVESHSSAPPVDSSWEEIVEVSFRPSGAAYLMQWAGEATWPLDLTVTDYRVRYCAKAMDAARRQDTIVSGEPLIDRYLLQFWPSPPSPDLVVKQTSEIAAYWHGLARDEPPPPTPEQKAEANRLAEMEKQLARAAADLKAEERAWGGSLPSSRLRRLRGPAMSIARLDRPLVDALGAADAETQRDVARWVTRRAFAEAGLTGIDWIAAALAAMDQGEQLPPPFDDDQAAWQRLFSDPLVPQTLVTSPDGQIDNCSQQAMAFPAVFSARIADPLAAAFDALSAAYVAFGYGRHNVLFAEVREMFPAIRQL